MNKEKLTLAVIGGIFGLAILAAGYFAFAAYSERGEAMDAAEAARAKARSFTTKAIYPCAASVRAVESNVTALVEWKDQSLKAASRGDRIFDKTTAAAFKTMIIEDSKRLWRLHGAVDEGHIVKKDFDFGPFRDYIAGGKMPEEANLPTLQRQWDDMALIIELLSTNGVAEVTAIDLKAEEVKVNPETLSPKGKGKKKTKKKAQVEVVKPTVSYSYVVQFSAKQDVFVRVINAFATCERFTVIDDFGFTRPADVIAQLIGGEAKKAAPEKKESRRSRRRNAAQATQEAKQTADKASEEAEKKNGIITDPAADKPLAVTMKITVVDFRTLEEEAPVEEPKKETKK